MDFSRITNPKDANLITRAYLDSLLVEPRYLDTREPSLEMSLYGKTFSSPIMIAAFSHLDGYRANGMVEMARGAVKANCCNWAGFGNEEELKNILSTGANTIKIVKPYADRSKLKSMIQYAEENGALAVGIDIDHGIGHDGKPDNIRGVQMYPVSQNELADFVKSTNLPFIVKGVLSLADAHKCVEAGVKGLVISHHHGITPCAIPPLMLLPFLRRELGKEIDLFVDCSIDDGIDAFKALALGAKAVNVGRSILPALQENGAEGVYAKLKEMEKELRDIMAKTCSYDVEHIMPNVIWDSFTGKPIA